MEYAYKVENIQSQELETKLNELGKKGWKLEDQETYAEFIRCTFSRMVSKDTKELLHD